MRRLRIRIKGKTYYVTATGNRDALELKKEWMKDLMIKLIKIAKTKYRFRLKNFSIMDGHIHLLIRPFGDKEMISKIMQWLLGTSAVIYNKTFGVRGKFWFDRFKSTIVKSVKEFVTKFQSINNNPVKLKIVKSIKNYKYCGNYYISRNDFSIVDRLPVFLRFLIE